MTLRFRLLFLAAASLLALPAAAQQFACNLGMTLNCNGASCTATTVNLGSNTCSGEYIVGFIIADEQKQGTVTNFSTTLPLSGEFCLDNTSFPTIGEGLGACVGIGSLGPGASFTSTGNVNFAGAQPSSLLAVTIVDDPNTDQTLAEAYVINQVGPVATCTPVASVPPVTQSGSAYNVTWTAVTEPNATYTVEESTSPNFSPITDTRQTNSLSATFQHSVTTSTNYFYRVRANTCGGAAGSNSTLVAIVVQPVPVVSGRQGDVVTPVGSTNPVQMKVNIPGPSAPVPFTASVNKPYFSVSPSSGTLGTSGMTLTITANPSNLPPGANTGTLTVTTGSGKIGASGTTTTSTTVSVSLTTPVAPGTKSLPPSNTLIIPAVAHAPGALGPFQSDVRLTNAGAASTSYQLTYTPQGTDATQSSKQTTITIDPGQTIALNDILNDFFGVGSTGQANDQGQGALEIRPLNSSSNQNYASSRTFTFNAKGTFGQFIAAIPFSTFATKAALVPIPGRPAPTGTPSLSLQQVACCVGSFRTNLGIAEGSGTPANGHINLYDVNGTQLGSVPYSLLPGEQLQKPLGPPSNPNSWLLPEVADGRIEVTVESSTGAVTAYASVLDNNTNDPLEVTPVQVSQVSANRYILPGMAALGSTGTGSFHSDVRLFNGGTTAVTVTPTYYPQGGGTPVAGTPFTLGGGQVKAFNDMIATTFNQPSSGGQVVFTTAAASSLVATGTTYTIDPTANNGRYGQFIPGVMSTQGIANGDQPLQILQLEQSTNFRSNVAVFELTGNPATVHITAYVPDSKITASTDVQLAGNQFMQLNSILAGMYPGQDVYNARVSVQVTGGTGRVSAYGSIIDNASLDPTYVPAQ
ncbi:MAG TPA: hypothetical protein VL284_08800 [Thermoanaerobaculia bacterium]|nr:hypothetical protein [Thermoanaerobaculia bacterium]